MPPRSEVTVPAGKPASFYNCVAEYAAAGSDAKKLNALVARHLAIADKLLPQPDIEVRRSGAFIAREAANCASDRLKDHELTVAIVEAYLIPNFELAHEPKWKHPSRESLIKDITAFYYRAGRHERMADAARLWIRIAPHRNSADAARARLAWALDLQGNTADAIAVLRQISDQTGMAGAKRFIPDLEAKLQK